MDASSGIVRHKPGDRWQSVVFSYQNRFSFMQMMLFNVCDVNLVGGRSTSFRLYSSMTHTGSTTGILLGGGAINYNSYLPKMFVVENVQQHHVYLEYRSTHSAATRKDD